MKFTFVNHVTTNPFFVPDQVRRRRRLQAAGLQLPVDGLGEQQRQRDGQRVQQRGQREGGRHRGGARRPEGLQRPDPEGARRRHPGRRLQRGRAGQRAGSPTSARTCSCPDRRWASASSTSSATGDVALFIATPGSLNIQPRIDGAIDAIKKSGKAITYHTVATGAARAEGAVHDRRLLARPQGHQGDVRRRRRQHPGRRPGDPEVQAARQGRQGRRLRPARADDRAARRGPDRLHDRPAAVPAGLPAGPPAVHVPGVGDAHRRGRRQHRPEVPRQGDGRALQDDEVPLRGQLEQGRRSPRSRAPAIPPATAASRRRRRGAGRPRGRSLAPGRRASAGACSRCARAASSYHARGRGVLRRDHRRVPHLRRTSRRCCRTSRRSRSSRRARCS